MTLATQQEIDGFLADHTDWSPKGTEITKTYQFADFVESIGFVGKVAAAAEAADHHPDIDIRWNKVTLTLSTHSEGGLTARDLELADRCDRLA